MPESQEPIDVKQQQREPIDLDESLARVEAGGIPLLARRRLAETSKDGAFTSDLSVADFALCHQLGLRPLSQVMGTSVYQIGYQPPGWGMAAVEMNELQTISHAWNDSRDRAFSRLAEEAALVGASAVVGVDVKSSVSNWAEAGSYGTIEYVITGTAIARETPRAGAVARANVEDDAQAGAAAACGSGAGPHPAAQAPILTELSIADYAKLLSAGIEPVGIVAWTSVFFVSFYFNALLGGPALGESQFSLGGSSFQNFELTDVTQCFYSARERVTGQLGRQAQALDASGIVGVRIAHTTQAQTLGGGPGARERHGMMASFSALGTAIQDHHGKIPLAPQTTIDLTS